MILIQFSLTVLIIVPFDHEDRLLHNLGILNTKFDKIILLIKYINECYEILGAFWLNDLVNISVI